MQIINCFEQIVYKYDLCLFVCLNLFLLHGLLRLCVKFNVFLLFTVCLYRYKYIWKNTWCCIILVSETKDWRLFELFVCLNSVAYSVLCLFCSTQHGTRWVVVYLLRLLFCFVYIRFFCSLCIITTFIRFCWFSLQVCVWVSEMMRLCGCVDKFNEEIEQVKKNKLQ